MFENTFEITFYKSHFNDFIIETYNLKLHLRVKAINR